MIHNPRCKDAGCHQQDTNLSPDNAEAHSIKSSVRLRPPKQSLSLLSRTITGLSIRRRGGESPEDIKGALGLNPLWEPADPIVDLVFVHGLGGGSRVSWSRSSDPESYWPKEWLSRDPEFMHVRIHSFGYSSKWAKCSSSVVDIADFAQSLVGALQHRPAIRRSENVSIGLIHLPVVLVGHSMGGLVIKKAYLLACRGDIEQELGRRIQAMYFLGTPHHGADAARLLTKLLTISPLALPNYVSNLRENCPAIQEINDDFRHHAHKLQLYSFWESEVTRLGPYNEIMVSRESAIMGYAHENVYMLNTDHRELNKFESATDPNFAILRNTLVTMIVNLSKAWSRSKMDQLKQERYQLRSLLSISDDQASSYVSSLHEKAPGTCDWLLQQPDFTEWRDVVAADGKLYWLDRNNDCSSYFFKEGDKFKSALSKCLCSFAYHMALADAQVRECLLQMDGVHVDTTDYSAIWRNVFVGAIFQLSSTRPHFWILDAMEECKDIQHFLPLTARKYVLDPNTTSEFAVNEERGNLQVALTCLKYLSSDRWKAPRTRRSSADSAVARGDIAFMDYSTKFFHEHVQKASSSDDALFLALHRFCVSSNVLTWIAHIADSGTLLPLVLTASTLGAYLKRRAKHAAPVTRAAKDLEAWAVDLKRIVAKFGQNLLRSPQSIYHIIPPFCPRDSMPHKLFGTSNRGIQITGLVARDWDDCLRCIPSQGTRASAVACNSNVFAIGCVNPDGRITLNDTMTCQQVDQLEHGKPVRALRFDIPGRRLASFGQKLLRLWNLNVPESSWSRTVGSQCIALAFTQDNKNVVVASRDNCLYFYDTTSGDLAQKQQWYMDVDAKQIHQAPATAAVSPELNLVAFVYRGGHIHVWDWVSKEYQGPCKRLSDRNEMCAPYATNIVFSPMANASLMAASYDDGEIIIYDPFEGEILSSENSSAASQEMACSPDGRTLVAGDFEGTLRIFDFATLKLLHIFSDRGLSIKSLSFCADGMRFVETRGTETNVWDPPVLIRDDPASELSSAATDHVPNITQPVVSTRDQITAIATDNVVDYIAYGTKRGNVCLLSWDNNRPRRLIYAHYQSITIMSFLPTKLLLVSSDLANRVLVHKLKWTSMQECEATLILDEYMESVVHQLLLEPNGRKLLVSCGARTAVYDLLTGQQKKLSAHDAESFSICTWANSPSDANQLLVFREACFDVRTWQVLDELPTVIPYDAPTNLATSRCVLRSTHTSKESGVILLVYAEAQGSLQRTRLVVLQRSSPSSRAVALQETAICLEPIIGSFGSVIDLQGKTMFFIDRRGCICSIDMDISKAPPDGFRRHFYLPSDWLAAMQSGSFGVRDGKAFYFAKGDEVIRIARGFDFVEDVPFRTRSLA